MPFAVPVDRRPSPRELGSRRVLMALVVIWPSSPTARPSFHLMIEETELIFRTAGAPQRIRCRRFPYHENRPAADRRREPIRLAHTPPTTEADRDTWVLFLHGNASTIASRMNVKHCVRLRELGLNVLAPEYHRLQRPARRALGSERGRGRTRRVRLSAHDRACARRSPG